MGSKREMRLPSPADGEVVLRAEDVHKRFDRERVVALNGVSLAVRRGDVIAITGPSGSGKSTLLNLLGFLDRPDKGTISHCGDVRTASSERELTRSRGRRMGFVFQDSLLDPARTALENVTMGLRFAGVPRRERRHLAEASLDMVGLADRAHSYAATLSGGERQRVALARATAHRPDVVLCDEPSGNLDAGNTQLVIDQLVAHAASGAAVVIVTHEPEVASQCERWADLRKGRLTWQAGASVLGGT